MTILTASAAHTTTAATVARRIAHTTAAAVVWATIAAVLFGAGWVIWHHPYLTMTLLAIVAHIATGQWVRTTYQDRRRRSF